MLFIVPFLAGSQWARYVQESQWYGTIEHKLFAPKEISFLLLLLLCYTVFLWIIRLGNRLINTPDGYAVRLGSPMIPNPHTPSL